MKKPYRWLYKFWKPSKYGLYFQNRVIIVSVQLTASSSQSRCTLFLWTSITLNIWNCNLRKKDTEKQIAASSKKRFFFSFPLLQARTKIHIYLWVNTYVKQGPSATVTFKTLSSPTCCAKDFMKNVLLYKKHDYLSLVSNHSKPPQQGVNQMKNVILCHQLRAGNFKQIFWRKATPERLPTITCRTVHHVRRHAVWRSLWVHQAWAVVHWLSVGGAGTHNTTLIHGRKIALPTRKKTHTHNVSLQISLKKVLWFVKKYIS